jgi:MoxR-like ATPase
VTQKTFEDLEEVYVPRVDPTFVPWGDFKTVKTVIDSRMFFPMYISGLSGNGKTMMVEQACAKSKREFVRVQISPETDESDLLGSFRLVDGETVFYKGPVIKAMERGAILLIDELDRGTNKIMCLQGVLEGKPVLLKKIGQVIVPTQGFNVIATANTKGNGSEDGRFSAASIIDEAFLERFVATIEQPYPAISVEKSIVQKHMTSLGFMDEEFADRLVAWSDIIRKTFQEGGMDDLISTRRLCHIVKSYSIFKNRSTAIAMCIARFAPDTASAFLDLYSKIDATVQPEPEAMPEAVRSEYDEVPF